MRETYQEFLGRIDSFETKKMMLGEGHFASSPSVTSKVDVKNCFKKFYGDTVVFNLNDATKKWIEEIVERLYEEIPECFAERLAWHTYHVTLHDLSNSSELQNVASELFWNELKVISVIKKVGDMGLYVATIKMKTKFIFNMVNMSLVLGLYPADEVEYVKLMQLYEAFDEVKSLPYPLTPHITLAYYNVEGFTAETAKRLGTITSELNEQIAGRTVELKCIELYYQKFVSMNDYIDIVPVGG